MVKKSNISYDNFISKFIDYDFINMLMKVNKVGISILLALSVLAFLNFCISFSGFSLYIFRTVKLESLFYILCALIMFLMISDNRDKHIGKIKLIFIFLVLFFIFCLLNCFSFLPIDIIYLKPTYFMFYGLGVMVSYIFILWAEFSKKFVSFAQILSVIFLLIGYGGFIVYAGFSTQYDLAFEYWIFNCWFSVFFFLLLPNYGLVKYLCLKSSGSKLARTLSVFVPIFLACASSIAIFLEKFHIFSLPKGCLTAFAIIILIIVIYIYSWKLTLDDFHKNSVDKKTHDVESFFEDLLDHMVDGIFVSNKNGDFIYANDAVSKYFRVKKEDILKSNIAEGKWGFKSIIDEYDLAKSKLTPQFIDSTQILFNDSDGDWGFLKSAKSSSNSKNIENSHSNDKSDSSKDINKLIGNLNEDIPDNIFLSGWIIPIVINNQFEGAIITSIDVTGKFKKESMLKSSINEKNSLLSEVHHRVKTNMQIINSLLNIHSYQIDDVEVKGIIRESQSRIISMALVHESLFQNLNFSNVDIKQYLGNLIDELKSTYCTNPNVDFNIDLMDIELNLDKTIPLGLIVNEILTNCLKYAFPDNQKGVINISFTKNEDYFTLIIEDNGIGLDNSETSNSKSDKSAGIGNSLIYALSNQIEAELSIESNNGVKTTIIFKE